MTQFEAAYTASTGASSAGLSRDVTTQGDDARSRYLDRLLAGSDAEGRGRGRRLRDAARDTASARAELERSLQHINLIEEQLSSTEGYLRAAEAEVARIRSERDQLASELARHAWELRVGRVIRSPRAALARRFGGDDDGPQANATFPDAGERSRPVEHTGPLPPPVDSDVLEDLELVPIPTPRATEPLRHSSGTAQGLLVVSHLVPGSPRAGNEYRFDRLLRWLRREGHHVTVLVCPLPGDHPDPRAIREAVEKSDRLIVLDRSGRLYHNFAPDEVGPLLNVGGSIAGRRRVSAAGICDLAEQRCPSLLIDLVAELTSGGDFSVVLAQYAFMADVFRRVPASVTTAVDTIDVLSSWSEKVIPFGIDDNHGLSEAAEAGLLGRAGVVIGIQPEESEVLRRLVPTARVITVGVDFDSTDVGDLPDSPVAVLVASGNPLNRKAFADLARFGWPIVRRLEPQARLLVVGEVGLRTPVSGPGIEVLGRVDELSSVYACARLALNPAVAGTGLKIKTIEALAFRRPVIAFPAGVEGLDASASSVVDVVHDWYQFAHATARRLRPGRVGQDENVWNEVIAAFETQRVYAPLAAVLDESS